MESIQSWYPFSQEVLSKLDFKIPQIARFYSISSLAKLDFFDVNWLVMIEYVCLCMNSINFYGFQPNSLKTHEISFFSILNPNLC